MSEPSAPGEGGFSRRTAGWLAAVSAISLASAVLLAIFGGGPRPGGSAGADTFSRSAIGHRALVELLDRRGTPVLVSEHDTGAKLAADAVLVAAEPVVEAGDRAGALTDMVTAAPRALVVLPKWYGEPDELAPSRVAQVALLPAGEVEPVLRALGVLDGAVVRLPRGAAVQASGPALGLEPLPAPDLVGPQLVTSAQITPIVQAPEGILVGELELDGALVWVLSDPDLVSNHGLGRGHNAALALALIDALRGDRGAVVFDETLHGFKSEPSIWRVLFEFPLVLATIQVLLAVALLLWAGTGRFGRPAPAAPPIAPGKEFLIDNTAALLRFGGHAGFALRRYLATSAQEVARALHAPAHVLAAGATGWLDQVAAARGVRLRLANLEREVEEAGQARRERAGRVVATARRIHQWREEMTHGSRDRSRPR